jgi:hypothetical protein
VLICAQVAPRQASITGRIVSSTASASLSMVTTTSAPEAALDGSSAISMPLSASGSARSRVRFHALTSSPAGAAMLRAIGKPMMPVPRTATRI